MASLRPYRFLFYVLSLAGVALVWELNEPDPQLAKNPQGLPDLMRTLYPQNAHILYVEGVQGVLNGDLRRAREKFEAALATGNKTNEALLYYYAVTLVRMKADPAEIESAITAWRFNFPYSSRPNPRSTVETSAPSKPLGEVKPAFATRKFLNA